MRKNRLYLLFIVVIVLSLFCVTPLLAKYFHNEKNNFGVESPEFYFNSDLLEIPQTNGIYPQYKLNEVKLKFNSFTLGSTDDICKLIPKLYLSSTFNGLDR